MFDLLLSLVAPHYCGQCGHVGSLWCEACRIQAPAAVSRCYRCHRLTNTGRTCPACRRTSPLDAVRAATRYEGCTKQLVWRTKFVRAQAGAAEMADLAAARCPLSPNVLVVPVPTSTTRVRQRGYDQAVLLARRLARLQGCQYYLALLRLGKQQQHTASRKQRLTQLAEAFVVRQPETIAGRYVVLVDDVITTGATLEAAARALKAAGAKRVSAVVFAQA